jgi:Flp pilus assembly protein TadG
MSEKKSKNKPAKKKSLLRDTRGAVLAEFIIASMPIFIAFFTFVQLAKVATARLVLKHSAIVGARAAAVIVNGKDNNPGQKAGMNEAEVLDGVTMALGPWWKKPGGFTNIKITITDSSSKDDPYGWVTVRVEGTYNCAIPLGQVFVCRGSSMQMTAEEYRMPHQGANYKM